MAAITSSAIYNAIGKWILDYPITPDKVLKALGKI
jgi:CO/xanthine dehydrogenase Mo-binding subunit